MTYLSIGLVLGITDILIYYDIHYTLACLQIFPRHLIRARCKPVGHEPGRRIRLSSELEEHHQPLHLPLF